MILRVEQIEQAARHRRLIAAATLFAAVTVLYSAIWMTSVGPSPIEGLRFARATDGVGLEITGIVRVGRGEFEGLRLGDRVTAINGLPAGDARNFYDALVVAKPGDQVQLTLERRGETRTSVLGLPRAAPSGGRPAAQEILETLMGFYPVLFFVVGIAVLFLRVEDPNAWLLALMFGGFIARAPLHEGAVPQALRGFAVGYQVAFFRLQAPLFLYFFLVFPARSLIERKLPWLKHVVLWGSAVWAIPLAVWCFVSGGSLPLWRALLLFKSEPANVLSAIAGAVYYGSFGVGLLSLILNGVMPGSNETRRKARVIVWGTVLGLAPMMWLGLEGLLTRRQRISFWYLSIEVLALSLIPSSFAYAVLKHRVMEIPVLLRRGARYVLVQRGFVVLVVLFAAAVTAGFAALSARVFQSQAVELPTGLSAGVIFGMALAWGGARAIQRVTRRIDRSFFRGAYDARRILEELSQQIRTISTRSELSDVLWMEIEFALHPKSMAVFLMDGDGYLRAHSSDVHGQLSPESPLLAELTRRGEVRELTEHDLADPQLQRIAALQAELLVPVLGRDGQLAGLLALGMRLSEEPYSREDKRLLASVAAQAGLAMESIRLTERIMERAKAEARAAQEMEIAKQVQARLLPQRFPEMKTLEYAGRCVQARQVGGDYYDFLSFAPERLGIVLADVAGKGISAALLMANLQANLRGQSAEAAGNLSGVLQSVNRLFFNNTGEDDYATLFFADYDGGTGRLRYANCGHNPPLLLRRAGGVERLTATSTVLGLFEDWVCETAETRLESGDLLVIYSDGLTEAASESGEEFGEDRLLQAVERLREKCASELMEGTIAAVEQFSTGIQADDITLVVARRK